MVRYLIARYEMCGKGHAYGMQKNIRIFIGVGVAFCVVFGSISHFFMIGVGITR